MKKKDKTLTFAQMDFEKSRSNLGSNGKAPSGRTYPLRASPREIVQKTNYETKNLRNRSKQKLAKRHSNAQEVISDDGSEKCSNFLAESYKKSSSVAKIENYTPNFLKIDDFEN